MWPYFERMRNEAPVHYCAKSQFGPYWSLTKFDDIMYCDTHHQIFSSDSKIGGISLGGGADPDPQFDLPMFIQEDPPKHENQRKVVAPMFTPRNLMDLEPMIRERACKILDNLPRNEDFNWVRHVSVELTGQMLATLFDIPQEDRHKLIYWSDSVSNLGNPEYFETVEQGFKVLWECYGYFDEVWKERVKNPHKARPDLHAGAWRIDQEHAAERIPRQHSAAHRRRQRHHAQLDYRRRSCVEPVSQRVQEAARQPGPDHQHDPRDHPLAVAGGAHGAHGARRHRDRRPADQAGRKSGDVVHLGQPRLRTRSRTRTSSSSTVPTRGITCRSASASTAASAIAWARCSCA